MRRITTTLSRVLGAPSVNRALLLILASTLCAATANGIIRSISDDMHPFEIAFFRAVLALAIFVPLMSRGGIFALFRTNRLGLQLIRGAFQGTSMLLFFLAISLIPLAKVSALSFSSPLFACVLAILALGEVVRARRITALAIGFFGTLIIVRPGAEPFSLGDGVVLASAALAGISFMLMKVLAKTERSITTILYGALIAAPVSLIAAVPYWTPPTLNEVPSLVGVGILASLANLCRAQALKEADITIVAPFEFLKLPWTATIGFTFYSEIPEVWTWIGGGMIFTATTYLAYRERQLKKAARTSVLTGS